MIDYYDKPFIIGIAGGSASGKTTVANKILDDFTNKGLNGYIISIDDFYISLTDEEKIKIKDVNFDDPKRIEFSELEKVLLDVQMRKKINIPTYDFKTYVRVGQKTLDCSKIDYVIVEGLFCLYNNNIRKLIDASIFIDISDEIRWKRRVSRDIVERGANLIYLTNYYNTFVKPSYNKNVFPTSQYANKVITDNNTNTFTIVVNWLSSKFYI